MNGIVASYITLSSYEIVFTRTLIGSPLLIAIFALSRQKVNLFHSKKHMLCLIVSGMLCVNAQALNEGKTTWGLFCGVMSALMYALMVIFNKKADRITGLENSMWQLLTAFLTVAVFIGIKQGFVIHIESGDWIPILILGIFNTGVGCYFYFSSIGNLPVQTVAICGYLEPLSAVVFSILLLHERMAILQVIGTVLILGGAAFGELFHLRSKMESNLK